MKHLFRVLFVVVLTAAIVILFAIPGRRPAAQAEASAGRVPILVELFTSEGCSSCPPADTLLKDLQKHQPVPGAEVIALGEHVDYWNHGGWADPFSMHAFSERQSEYAGRFHNASVYTPQMIVDGRAEFVGSDDTRAYAAIRSAARAPKAQIQVSVGTLGSDSSLPVTISVRNLPTVASGDKAQVLLAVAEDGLQSRVTGGENAGRQLPHVAVTRILTTLGTIEPGQTFTASPSVALKKSWNRNALRVVVFVQERRSGHVLGAGVAGL